MPIYRMAGLNVKIEPKYEKLRRYAEKYLCSDADIDDAIDINISQEYIDQKKQETPYLTYDDIEYIWVGAKFATKLLSNNGFVLHSSAVAYDGDAYLFSAASGTGKSTHTGFWQKVFGEDKAVIINDDKPAIRDIGGVYHACGTAFSGKSPTSTDVQVPVKALCFIYRSEDDEIRKLDPSEALELIFEQTLWKGSGAFVVMVMSVLDDFLKKVPCYSVGVTYSEDSARFVYNALNS